jgi:urease accessory protein
MMCSQLLRLLHLCDPSLPIGGFSHSAGLETYVQHQVVNSKDTLKEFVINQLSENLFYTDAALLSLAYDAAEANDVNGIIKLDELFTAVKLPMEMRTSSHKLGLRLLKIFGNHAGSLCHRYLQLIQNKAAAGHYCIAFALVAFELQIEKQQAISGFYYNAATGFITNGVKLIPLGQLAGQELVMEVLPLIEVLALQSMKPDKELIGYCCNGFDIRSMQHEQLYTRLYMS